MNGMTAKTDQPVGQPKTYQLGKNEFLLLPLNAAFGKGRGTMDGLLKRELPEMFEATFVSHC